MDKNTFGKLLDCPGSISADEWDMLRRELDQYPYSAPLQVLSLMADKASATPLWEKRALPRVTLYCQDGNILRKHLASMDVPRPHTKPAQPTPTGHEPAFSPNGGAQTESDNDTFDILQAINSYQEVSFKTAPKSVILSNFLEKDAGLAPSDEVYEDISVQELAQKSVSANNTLESETLAIILERQGKLAQSLAMYEKLMINNPEKSSIFAVRIADLKARLLEQK